MSLLLLFRSPLGKPYSSYWGPHFPRKSRGHNSHWNRHFPDQPSTTVPGTNPAGAAAFALLLETGATVTFTWQTGLFKAYSGKERRSNLVDDPAIRFEGQTLLVGSDLRRLRSRIARFAALGRPFLLGLPYEALTISIASTGTTVNVYSTARADWALPGARVIVRHARHGAIEAVIQSVSTTQIGLDVALGDIGGTGAMIMPAAAVFLDPQQSFARYPTPQGVEHWALKARNANAGFASSSVAATIELADVTGSGTLDGLRYVAREAGAAGNGIVITQSDDALSGGGEVVEDTIAGTVHVKFVPGDTSVAQFVALVNGASELVKIIGTAASDTAKLVSTADEFTALAMSGGSDGAPAVWGLGATLTTFAGAPVWDRGLEVDGTIDDSVQAMAEVQDLGGLPFATQTAIMADWGRRVQISGPRWEPTLRYQWLKRFLDTVKGRWKSWWLPTMRPDLVALEVGAGTLTVESGESDVFAWWPLQRQYLMTRLADGSVVYLKIADAVDNHDGTVTLHVVDAADVDVTLAGVPDLVSWLERCRFEADEIPVTFKGADFGFSAVARAEQQDAELSVTTLAEIEASVELSQPREGIEIALPTVTYRVTTNTRDVVIGGATFSAYPAARDELKIAIVGQDADTVVRLPVSHPAVARYLQGGIPPRTILVDIWRRQGLGVEETVWRGIVVSVASDGIVASLKLASRSMHLQQRRLPTITIGRACPHILYAANTCRKDRTAFKVSTTVASYNGRVVTLASIGGHPDQWARGGELVHVASGERMTVEGQVGAEVTGQLQIQGIAIGDDVELYAGCDHNVQACRDKFDNMDNFGGFPQLSTEKPFQPGKGFGIVVQP